MLRELLGHVLDALDQRALGGKQKPVGAPQIVNIGAREAAPLQADDVETRKIGAIAERHAVGNEIVLEPRHAANERVRADPRELDDRRAAADDRVVADGAMARKHDVVGEDDAVADAAIVADVAVGEEGAAVADRGGEPPPSVPGFMVTPSRMMQSAPIVSEHGSP